MQAPNEYKTAVDIAYPGQATGRRWALVLIAWALLLGGLAAAFGNAFWCMWIYHWFPAWSRNGLGLYDRLVEGESYYTHAPLVAVVSAVIGCLLLRYTKITVRPRPVLGAVVLVLSLLVQLASCLVDIQFVQGFAFIGVVVGVVLSFWGLSVLRRLWFPIAILAFMMPLPPMVIAQLNFRLKMLAADWGVALANLAGIAAERSGARLFIGTDKEMVVGNVCSGLRTLISLLAFGAVYAYVCRLRGWWRLGLFGAVLPVAVASNCIRVASLILVAYVWDVKTATGWYHDASGILVFVCAFLLMFGLEKAVLWSRAKLGRPATVTGILEGVRVREGHNKVRALAVAAGSWSGVVSISLVLVAAVGVQWIAARPPRTMTASTIRSGIPASLTAGPDQYSCREMELDDKTLMILQTRDYVMRRYEGARVEPIDLCITYSQGNRRGSHPPEFCLEGAGGSIVAKGDVMVRSVPGQSDLPCRELILQKGGELEYYLYTYRCGNSYTSSWYWQQVAILGGGLLGDNKGGALIRLSTPIRINEVQDARQRTSEFMRVLIPHVSRALR